MFELILLPLLALGVLASFLIGGDGDDQEEENSGPTPKTLSEKNDFFNGTAEDCPSSDKMGQDACFVKGASGSSFVYV